MKLYFFSCIYIYLNLFSLKKIAKSILPYTIRAKMSSNEGNYYLIDFTEINDNNKCKRAIT